VLGPVCCPDGLALEAEHAVACECNTRPVLFSNAADSTGADVAAFEPIDVPGAPGQCARRAVG
jgi:hypothetical protein